LCPPAILPSTTSTLAPLISFNSTDKDFQNIPQLRASIKEIKNHEFFSNNIIPTPFSLPVIVTTFNMTLNNYISEPISDHIFNTILIYTTIIRTDTFPYGTVPSEFQYGTSPLRPDTLQYGTNLKALDNVPLLFDTAHFTFIR